MGVKVTNNAFGTLSAGINSSVTTIALDAGQGAKFPTLTGSDFFFATIIDTSNNLEIVKVTARSNDSMTVVRGHDNTTARSFSTGDRFELRPVAALFESIIDAAGDVTLTGTETLTNKTITSPKIGTAILDTNGNELFKLTATGSAVNELTYANAATGNKPTLTASGGDTNIGVSIQPKGSGQVTIYNLTYPAADGSANQFLKTDGSGNLSFDAAGGGKVLQVVTVQKNDTFSTSSTSDTTVTGLTLNITPSATSSKIFVLLNLTACLGHYTDSNGVNSHNRVNLFRGSTNIVDDLITGQGSRTGTLSQHGFRTFGHIEALCYHLIDLPNSTSQQTYTVKVKARSSTIFINRHADDSSNNNANTPRGISTLTCMEIGA